MITPKINRLSMIPTQHKTTTSNHANSNKKILHARGLLKLILWDFDRMLEDNTINTKTIFKTIKKRLNRIKSTKWMDVDWR